MMLQVAEADPAFLRWACRAVMSWEADDPRLPGPIHQIHGDRDRFLPWRLTKPDVLVRGGGHVLTLSHPQAVNNFIISRM
jgi:pimeloyl-ACP methyl ester carboxylesterase